MEKSNPFGSGSGNGTIETIDPRSIGSGGVPAGTSPAAESTSASGTAFGSGATAEPRKRRGRPPGSKNRQAGEAGQKAKVPVDRDAISAILFSVHTMLASAVKTPELVLDESESKAIADASAKVADLYDVSADPKVVAWCNLAMVCGTVYGTRFIAIRVRKKSEQEKRKGEKVVPITGGTFTGPGKLPPFDGGTVQ